MGNLYRSAYGLPDSGVGAGENDGDRGVKAYSNQASRCSEIVYLAAAPAKKVCRN